MAGRSSSCRRMAVSGWLPSSVCADERGNTSRLVNRLAEAATRDAAPACLRLAAAGDAYSRKAVGGLAGFAAMELCNEPYIRLRPADPRANEIVSSLL